VFFAQLAGVERGTAAGGALTSNTACEWPTVFEAAAASASLEWLLVLAFPTSLAGVGGRS
jgi:poly(3-hydroxybutyrate) depolymerase